MSKFELTLSIINKFKQDYDRYVDDTGMRILRFCELEDYVVLEDSEDLLTEDEVTKIAQILSTLSDFMEVSDYVD